jgi:hypothetical protein
MVLATVAIAPAYFLAQSFSDPATRLLLGAVVAAPLYFWLSYLMNREWVTAMMHLAGRGRLASA